MPFPRSPLPALIRLPLQAILALLIVLDELARPIYRPLVRWVSSWRLAELLEAWVARQHRLVVLVALVIPLLLVEPFKVVGLVWIGQGRFATGGLTMATAYLFGFLVVERIYRAGRRRLMTFAWFAKAMGYILASREVVMGLLRDLAIRRWIAKARISARRAWRGARAMVRRILPRWARRAS